MLRHFVADLNSPFLEKNVHVFLHEQLVHVIKS